MYAINKETDMVFSSAVFLFIFLPVVLFVHTVVKNTTARNIFLIAASLVFYAFGEPFYVLLMIGSVAINYLFGRVTRIFLSQWEFSLWQIP